MRWQDAILAQFGPKSDDRQSILAIDPDGLMQDDSLIGDLLARNYDILPLRDEVSFRHAFERDYRSRWDQGEIRHLIVIVHTQNGHQYIPYDIYQKSERLNLSVSELFPRLNAIVVRGLDHGYYADLYPAHQQQLANQGAKRLDETDTIEFILRTVFNLDPAAAATAPQLTALLIKKHHSGRALPPALEDYLIQRILPRGGALGLTSDHFTHASTFFAWLGDRWADCVGAVLGSGATAIDFARPELRLLIDNLFADNLITRLPYDRHVFDLSADQQWVSIGMAMPSATADRAVKDASAAERFTLEARLTALEKIDATNFTLRDWLETAGQWAEVVFLANRLSAVEYDDVQPRFFKQRAVLDRSFVQFVQAKYGSISFFDDNQGPISLAQVNHWLAARHKPDERVALICFDGLALDQWLLLRDYLKEHIATLRFDEARTYAIAPTITPVSRQALFAGDFPRGFADSIDSTGKDGAHWRRFWINHEVPDKRMTHLSVQTDGAGLTELRQIVDSNNRRLGIVINLFDDVMHATTRITPESDKRVYYPTLRAHLDNSRLLEVFKTLLAAEYQIYLTSDHGNVSGLGNGLTPHKVLIDKYAQRVVLYDSEVLGNEYATAHGLLLYRTKFLPAGMYPVYLPTGTVFGKQGVAQISHGGLSLEELVVPLITVNPT
jgi:hypothetical protein